MSARGLTLLEAVIATAVLGVIVLVVLSASLPLSDANAGMGAALDMDRDASRFFGQLRREVRQSGYQSDGTPRLRVQGADRLELYVRRGPDGAPEPWAPAGTLWDGAQIRYEASAPVAGRRSITRRDGTGAARLLENVQSVSYSLPADSLSLGVTLVLVRRGHRAKGGAAPADVVRTYRDTIAMKNRHE